MIRKITIDSQSAKILHDMGCKNTTISPEKNLWTKNLRIFVQDILSDFVHCVRIDATYYGNKALVNSAIILLF